MYTMKQACEIAGLPYETLKFYCNEGLVPNIARNKNNHRIFSEEQVSWISHLYCLKNCDMSIKEMKAYLTLCYEGEETIDIRKKMLNEKREALVEKMNILQKHIEYIDGKQQFYADVQSGKIPYLNKKG